MAFCGMMALSKEGRVPSKRCRIFDFDIGKPPF